jgi:siroheme synthase
VGSLATIEQRALRAQLGGPALCIVGEVVALALTNDTQFRFESGVGL